MIDLKLLQHALMLATHRSFARAAEALDMSQPALSRSIAGLEAALGVQLFNRTRHGVDPTMYGERLLARGSALLDDAIELERELVLMQGPEFVALRVGAGTHPADFSIGPALARLLMRHPRLRVEVTTADWRVITQDLLGARLDVAVVDLRVLEHNPRLHTEALPQHEGVIFCAANHPLRKKKLLTIGDVFEFPFVSTKLPPHVARSFLQFVKVGAIDPATGDYVPPIKVDTIALTKSIVASSHAVGIAPLRFVADEVRSGSLAVLPLQQDWLHTNYGFAYLKDRMLSPASTAFITEVKAVEAELTESVRRLKVVL